MPKVIKKKQIDVTPKEEFVHARDAQKSFEQLAADTIDALKENPVEEKAKESTEKPVEESQEKHEEPPKVPEKPAVDPEQFAKDSAARVAEEVTKRLAEKEEASKKLADLEAQKKKDADDLTPVWVKENREPKTWQEVAAEQDRINEVKITRRIAAIEAEKTAAQSAKEAEAKKSTEVQQRQQAERVTQLQQAIDAELGEMYEKKVLPPPTNGTPSQEVQDLLQFGIELNTKRNAEGKPPISSMSTLYFLHYKPFQEANPSATKKQPAGANAPVSGAGATTTSEQPEDVYIAARDRRKSFRQLAEEQLHRK